MKIQYLITTVSKTKNDIANMLDSLKIKGNILVGNQLMDKNSEYEIKTEKYNAKVYNMTTQGVSINRNFLTKKANAEYITYLDDDIYFEEGMQQKVEKLLINSSYKAIRFNVSSDNESRKIKQLSKRGFIGFRKLSSFGVCGIFFNRTFLIDNEIKFHDAIGPGKKINHGEDTVFNRTFLKYSKIYSVPISVFRARQIESTWKGEDRNIEIELFSHGYVYHLLYSFNAKMMAILYSLTHMKYFPKGTKLSFVLKNMFKGIKAAKQNEKSSKI